MITTSVAVRIRQAAKADRLDLAEMLLRCSAQTRYQRFHGFLESFPEPYFSDALAGNPHHLALVAESPDRLVALASCVRSAGGTGELAILVEDSYQRRGIGTRLLHMLIQQSGQPTITASVLAGQNWILPRLSAYGTCQTQTNGGITYLTVGV